MKYLLGGVSLFLFGLSLIVSCSSSKTYAQMLEEEQAAIHSYINDNNLKIITEMPTDTVFGEKEFLRFSNGLYMNIVYRGNLSSRPQYDTSNIMVRFKDVKLLTYIEDSTYFYGNWFDRTPFEFVYGSSPRAGWDYPLQYVGDSAVVRLIVPSKLGTSGEQSAVYPYYYGYVRYIIEKP